MIRSTVLQSKIQSLDYRTRCKAQNILTGIALVKRAIKILSTLTTQSEAEVDFIAATYGREWPQSELEVIVFEMEKYLAEYFAYAFRECDMFYMRWHAIAIKYRFQLQFEVDLPLTKISLEINHRTSNFATFFRSSSLSNIELSAYSARIVRVITCARPRIELKTRSNRSISSRMNEDATHRA